MMVIPDAQFMGGRNNQPTRDEPRANRTARQKNVLRRRVLQMTGGFALTGLGTQASAVQDGSPRLEVTQGGETHVVEPLSGPNSAKGFYNMQNGSSHTLSGLERPETSLLFFWEGANGEISLVTIHGDPSNDTGGSVRFDFTGLPVEQGRWVVMDDTLQHGNDFDGPKDTEIEWTWTGGYNDGGVFQGGLTGEFEITITPEFNFNGENERVTSWQLLSGSHIMPERISLDLDEPVTITPTSGSESGSSANTGPDSDATTDTKTTEDVATIQAVVPTHVNGNQPAKLRNEQYQTEKLWAMQRIGEEWPSTDWTDLSPFSDDSPPEWVTKFEDNPDDSKKYVRVPAFLIVSSSLDTDRPLFQNVEITEGGGVRCLGVEDDMLPDQLPPGQHQFYIVLKLATQPHPSIGNYVGSLDLKVDIPDESPVMREATRNHPRWSDANGLTVNSQEYTAPYSVQDEYSEALKQGITDLLWLLKQSVSVLSTFTLGGITAFPLKRTITKVGKTAFKKGVTQFIDPNHIFSHDNTPLDPKNIEDLEQVSVVSGTTFLRGETEDNAVVGLSGPMLTVAANTQE